MESSVGETGSTVRFDVLLARFLLPTPVRDFAFPTLVGLVVPAFFLFAALDELPESLSSAACC